MLFTKASEYALLSTIALASSDGSKDVETLSSELNISKSFLAKILQNLARGGILHSYKGAGGGFILAHKPAHITIHAILTSAEKRDAIVFECSKDYNDCPQNRGAACGVWPVFNALQFRVDEFLQSITLADIMKNRS